MPAFLLVALLAASPALPAQSTTRVTGGVGLYNGDPGLDGPVLYTRWLRPVAGPLWGGVRAEFRDDDYSYGRAQALAGGGELALRVCCPGTTVGLYLPAAATLEYQWVSHRSGPVRPTGAVTGVAMRVAVGLGIELGRFQIDARRSYAFEDSYTAVTLGIGSPVAGREPGSTVHLYGNTLYPFGSTYVREPDFRGYTIAYEKRMESWADGFRGTLGIDFVDFTYSTGLIHLLIGPVWDLVSSVDGQRGVSLVVQAGRPFFAEGGSAAIPAMASAGLEARIGGSGARLLGGLSLVGVLGPEGPFAGVQPRIGIGVGL